MANTFVIPAVADAVLRHQVFQAGAAAEPGADQVAAVVGRIAAVMAGFPLGRGVAHPVGLGQMELALGADDASLAVQTVVVPVGDVFAGGKVFYLTNLYGQFTDATHNYTAVGSSPQADQAVRERIESLTADFFVQALLEDAAGGTSGG